MRFTDDELKRLGKECDEISADIAASLFPGGIRFGIRLTKHCHAVKDLIARLEAAELKECNQFHCGHETCNAWREVAGRSWNSLKSQPGRV